jgi:cobaltochelatase CobN
MHLLATTSASLDDLVEPVDLRQEPADMVALSFTDSDLAAIATAWQQDKMHLSSLRLASLAELRHPMSVDLWIDAVAAHARIILVRLLGGYDWWRYGCDRLAALCRERGIRLALLPGESCEDDQRLVQASTLPPQELQALLAFFREGGPDNMRALLRRLDGLARGVVPKTKATPVPRAGYYLPGSGIVDGEVIRAIAQHAPASRRGGGHDVVPILFYRSMLLAADIAPIDALFAALAERGLAPLPIFIASLRETGSLAFVNQALADFPPAAIVTATAFASSAEPAAETLFDRAGVPVFQAVIATTRREAWQDSERGLAPADLAMHVVLPEIDGRIMGGALSFKTEREADAALGFPVRANRPEPDRVAQLAARVAAMVRLQQTPRAQRRLAVILPDYPNAPGRAGYAVGLDVPQSVLEMLKTLKDEGYGIDGIPQSARDLMRLLDRGSRGLGFETYCREFFELPEETRKKVTDAWGKPECLASSTEEGKTDAFIFRAATFGHVTVAFAPDRGRAADRRADYHDPALPPRHELIAFGLWLRRSLDCHAIVHVGAHGTLEWLPGKIVALSSACFPEIVTGPVPIIYPFIVSNPGEAAQAKRRIAAVTIGHLPPPLIGAGLSETEQKLERLVDEYAQAEGLDRRRRDRLARLIVETAKHSELAREAGVAETDAPDEVLRRIDAWLCDIKDFAFKDGQHIFGRVRPGECDPLRQQSAKAERRALIAALDGRHVPAGPAGAPARGRTDVLPTGRNLFAADPRALPTPTAFELGSLAAEEVLRTFLQEHGEWPRSLIIDLWGSASLRNGGEEVAQGLALMGCRPVWDATTGRVTSIEVLPPAQLGRPRVDVTFRISGLFRDMFPVLIALLDAALRAVAARTGEEEENPLAVAAKAAGHVPPRIFGSAPGTYGAGAEELLASGGWEAREEVGRAYLAAASHVFGGPDGGGIPAGASFAERVAAADLLVHSSDDPARDLLEGSADVAFIGGFAAALAALGRTADIVVLDTTDPARPRARSVSEAVIRIVRARAVNPRFIEGQLRHGPRGAAEFAETVDRLVAFAETTGAIPANLIDAVHDAYLGSERVRDFLLRENPAAARAIAERLTAARRRGLWHPRRNALDAELAALIAEARAREAA